MRIHWTLRLEAQWENNGTDSCHVGRWPATIWRSNAVKSVWATQQQAGLWFTILTPDSSRPTTDFVLVTTTTWPSKVFLTKSSTHQFPMNIICLDGFTWLYPNSILLFLQSNPLIVFSTSKITLQKKNCKKLIWHAFNHVSLHKYRIYKTMLIL